MAFRAHSKSREKRQTIAKVRVRTAPPSPDASAGGSAARLIPCKEMPGSGNTGPVNVVSPPR